MFFMMRLCALCKLEKQFSNLVFNGVWNYDAYLKQARDNESIGL